MRQQHNARAIGPYLLQLCQRGAAASVDNGDLAWGRVLYAAAVTAALLLCCLNLGLGLLSGYLLHRHPAAHALAA